MDELQALHDLIDEIARIGLSDAELEALRVGLQLISRGAAAPRRGEQCESCRRKKSGFCHPASIHIGRVRLPNRNLRCTMSTAKRKRLHHAFTCWRR